jgi:hypothetical protein
MLMHSQPCDKAMYWDLQAVVCILDLENRVGLTKSIESILRLGFSLALQGTLTWTSSKSLKKQQDETLSAQRTSFRQESLEPLWHHHNGDFCLTEDGRMGALSMDNNRTRANQIELLIDVSFPDDNPNKAILMGALVILRKNTDYTDEELFAVQENVDA